MSELLHESVQQSAVSDQGESLKRRNNHEGTKTRRRILGRRKKTRRWILCVPGERGSRRLLMYATLWLRWDYISRRD